MLPHTNIGVADRDDFARLREVTASQGLMLESVSERLMETVHAGSPTKHPAVQAGGDRDGGRAAHPLHQRDPRRHRRDRGRAGRVARGAGRGAGEARSHPGGDPPELRPASALLRGRGRRHRRGGVGATLGRGRLCRRRRRPGPSGLGLARVPRRHEAAGRRVPPADAGRRHPDPAEPLGLVGRAGRRGGDRPRRAVRQRRPHLARAPVPEPAPGPQAAGAARIRADRAALRLPAVHGPGVDGAGGARRDQAQVLELHPARGLGPPTRGARSPRARRRSDRDRRAGSRRATSSPRTS